MFQENPVLKYRTVLHDYINFLPFAFGFDYDVMTCTVETTIRNTDFPRNEMPLQFVLKNYDFFLFAVAKFFHFNTSQQNFINFHRAISVFLLSIASTAILPLTAQLIHIVRKNFFFVNVYVRALVTNFAISRSA